MASISQGSQSLSWSHSVGGACLDGTAPAKAVPWVSLEVPPHTVFRPAPERALLSFLHHYLVYICACRYELLHQLPVPSQPASCPGNFVICAPPTPPLPDISPGGVAGRHAASCLVHRLHLPDCIPTGPFVPRLGQFQPQCPHFEVSPGTGTALIKSVPPLGHHSTFG